MDDFARKMYIKTPWSNRENSPGNRQNWPDNPARLRPLCFAAQGTKIKRQLQSGKRKQLFFGEQFSRCTLKKEQKQIIVKEITQLMKQTLQQKLKTLLPSSSWFQRKKWRFSFCGQEQKYSGSHLIQKAVI